MSLVVVHASTMCVLVDAQGQLRPRHIVGERGPTGSAGHRPAHVQPDLTLATVPAGGQRRKKGEEKEEYE